MLLANHPLPRPLGANYELIEKIADGGAGTVFRGRNRTTGETVAIKLLARRTASGAEVYFKRFEQEFRVASTLCHPHIVRALDFGVDAEAPFLVMEFVDGGTLTDLIEREGPLSEQDAIDLATQVAEALDLAHQRKLVHRDIKPDNVLLTADGDAKLIDLGLVKESSAHLNLTRTGLGLGTPNFMAPEQIHDAKKVDVRSDIYGLAATLYMAVTGTLPFAGGNLMEIWEKKFANELPSPRHLAPNLSERIDWAIRRALSVEPGQRPASCRKFVEDLTGCRVGRKAPGCLIVEAPRDQWFLTYTDRDGLTHNARGTVKAVRKLLQDGLLTTARQLEIGTSDTGPFQPLLDYPEYRDMVIAPTALTPSQRGGHETGPATPGQPASQPTDPETSPEDADDNSVAWTWLLLGVLALAVFVAGLRFLSQ
jgi:serine/threonine protein kinase